VETEKRLGVFEAADVGTDLAISGRIGAGQESETPQGAAYRAALSYLTSPRACGTIFSGFP